MAIQEAISTKEMVMTELEFRPAVPENRQRMSVSEYLAHERQSEVKSEYIDGEKLEMAGVSIEHDRIVGNIFAFLYQATQDQATQGIECEPFTGDVRVQLTPRRHVYPDLTIVCGEPIFADMDGDKAIDILINPLAVFEVLSASTEDYDLGKKTSLYREVESMQLICLVAQDRAWVEVWTRGDSSTERPNNQPTIWQVQTYTGMERVASLTPLSIMLPLTQVYRRIAFSEAN
jgi:Uma2 family endonuclease